MSPATSKPVVRPQTWVQDPCTQFGSCVLTSTRHENVVERRPVNSRIGTSTPTGPGGSSGSAVLGAVLQLAALRHPTPQRTRQAPPRLLPWTRPPTCHPGHRRSGASWSPVIGPARPSPTTAPTRMPGSKPCLASRPTASRLTRSTPRPGNGTGRVGDRPPRRPDVPPLRHRLRAVSQRMQREATGCRGPTTLRHRPTAHSLGNAQGARRWRHGLRRDVGQPRRLHPARKEQP